MKWAAVLCLVALLFPAQAAVAQVGTGRIIGTVTDAQTAQPLSGVAVSIPNSRQGSLTGENGQFVITGVAAGTHTVRAQLIGYGAQEATVTVSADQAATVTLQLQPQAVALEGIVAIGYGTQRRQNIAGSVASVNMEALENAPVTSLDQMLQGTAPGVQVTQASSAPGGGISIRVRGSSSITGSSEPLYVIDGFPIDHDPEAASPGTGGRMTGSVPSNPLAALNPADIASIQVLKDASATAIYGARGANGVVIITTKQGSSGGGRPQVTFDMFTGAQEVARRYDLLTSRELAQAMNELSVIQGQNPLFTDAQINAFGAGTDWQSEIFRTAPLRSFQTTVSGGSAGENATQYAVSGGYFDQQGVVLGSSFERFSLRANLQQNFGERFRVGSSLSASRVNTRFVPTEGESNRRAGAVGGAIQAMPFLPVQFEDGRYPYQGRDLAAVGVSWANAGELINPVSMATQVSDDMGDSRVLGNAFGEYELLRGLRLRVSGGADYSSRFRNTYYPRTTRRGEEIGGEAIQGRAEILSLLNENILTYQPDLGSAHQLNVLAGYTWQTNENARSGMSGSDFVTDATGYNDIGAARVPGTPNSDRQKWALQSWLGRVNYTLFDRYLFTLTGRYDGSSRFSQGQQWGLFPSIAVGWRLSEESFMEGFSASNDLKLRASYGLAGNPGIRPYQSLARFITVPYSYGGTPATGYFPIGVANADLTWESTSQLDVGVDLTVFDRITFVADYYNKRTEDLLLEVDLPSESGFSRALVNAGVVENRGVELSINGDVIRRDAQAGGVRWNTGFTFARNRNQVVDIGGVNEIRAGIISDDFKLGGTVVRVGEPIGVFVGYQTGGVVRDAAHAAELASITNTFLNRRYEPGDLILVDLNGDGRIDGDDRTVIGSPHPDFTLGWQNSVSYRGFELSGFLQGNFGNEVLNLNLWQLTGGGIATNMLRERYEQRWTPENPNAKYPRLGIGTVSVGTDYNDLVIEDGSYLRLKTASLAYNLPSDWVRARGFGSARVYVSGSNLLTWTDYKGFDPEVSSFGLGNLNRGIDVGSYPSARSVTVGVNFAF